MSKKLMILGLIVAANTYGGQLDKNYTTKLNESVITTERYEETPVLEISKNVTVVTGEEIEERGYKNVEEALTMIPSLNLIEGEISIRGQVPKMGNRTVVILVDGVPQNGMDNRVADLDFIPREQVEKIEVLPSGGAVMYGGNASAGVINIVTKDNPDKKYWGRVGTEIGSFKYRKFNGTVGTKITNRLSSSVDYSTSDKKGYRRGEKTDLDFVQASADYKLDTGNIGFKYSHNKRDGSGRANALSRKEYEQDKKSNKYIGRNSKDIQDKYILNFDKKLTSNLEASGVLEYREREYKYRYPDDKNRPGYLNRDKKTDSFYSNIQLKYNYGNKSNVIIGTDYSKAKVKEKSYGYDGDLKDPILYNKKNTDTNFYAIGGYILNKLSYDKFLFTQGVRVEKNVFDEDIDALKTYKKNKKNYFVKPLEHEYSHSKFSPTNTDYELTANYLLDKDKSVYVSFNSVKRSPTLTEYSGWDIKDSPTRKSQQLDTIELGTKALFDNIYLAAATFYIHGKNEIMYDPAKLNKGGSFYNLNGKTERKGIELISEQYFGNLTLRQNFTYMDNKLASGRYKGNKIPGVPWITAGAGATYEIIENLFLNADLKYTGKSYFANDFQNEKDKASSHTLTDISLRYNMENGLSIYGGIDNLFGKKYYNYAYLSGNDIKYSPAPERTYYVGLDYKF